LQDFVGWTAIFWFMAGFGALCLAVTSAYVPETNLHRTARLSFGTVFADFSRLLRMPDFLLFALSGSLTSGVFFAFLGGAPYVAEHILDLSMSNFGLWFGTVALGYAGGSFLTGRYTERLGIARMILIGSILGLAAVLIAPILFLTGHAGAPALFLPMVAVGAANGIALPNAISGAISVKPEIAGAASGLSGAAQIGAGAMLSAVAGAVLTGSSTAMPMFAIMGAAALLALLCAVGVYRRNGRMVRSGTA
jgi:DHA1 family bicyclomycin/chloramphenicol resistance-like MFS transporter